MSKKKLELRDVTNDAENIVNPQPEGEPMTYDAWWAKMAARYQLPKNLKLPLMIHLKARGFWDGKRWDEGAEDFGYRLA